MHTCVARSSAHHTRIAEQMLPGFALSPLISDLNKLITRQGVNARMEATEQASKHARNGFWTTHMSGPFLRQTEEHRCSSRVVVCGRTVVY